MKQEREKYLQNCSGMLGRAVHMRMMRSETLADEIRKCRGVFWCIFAVVLVCHRFEKKKRTWCILVCFLCNFGVVLVCLLQQPL